MKLIKPSQISGEILTLFDEADEKVVIVSPYCKFQKWHKLVKKLKQLQDKKIKIEFYVRADQGESVQEIIQVGIAPILIENLHCKLYMNEKEAIVTSMNLHLSSEINSLEIAYKTNSPFEYKEISEFYERYLRVGLKVEADTKPFPEELFDLLSEKIEGVRIKERESDLHIKTRKNNYYCFIWNKGKGQNHLRINGILTEKEYHLVNKLKKEISDNSCLDIECEYGEKNHYNLIWGTSKESLKSEYIFETHELEIRSVAKQIQKFIFEVEKIKGKS